MKEIYKWTLLISCLQFFAGISQATTLLIPERQGPPGSLVRVDIAVDGADSLAGLELVLQYDETFLEFIEVREEGAVHDFLIATKEKEDQIGLSLARPEAIGQPYAVLFGLIFRIRQSVQIGSSTELTWRTTRLFSVSTAPIGHDAINGVVRALDIACYPNPFTPGDQNGINDVVYFLLPEEMMTKAQVKIFGIGSNLVRELVPQGGAFLQWDGKNNEGHMSKPGVYLYLALEDGKVLRKGTITLMR